MSELLQENAPDAASLRGQLKTFSAVFDGDPIDEREYIEVAVESTGADTTYTNPTSQEFMRRAARVHLAPGGALRQHRPLRAVVRDALGARASDRAARRPGRRRAARRLRALPARVPAPVAAGRAATRNYAMKPPSRSTCSRRWSRRRIAQRRKRLAIKTAAQAELPRPRQRPAARPLAVGSQGAAAAGPRLRTACPVCCATRTATRWPSASSLACPTWTRNSWTSC